MAFDQASCRRQEQHCLTLAAGAAKGPIKTHFSEMAAIWSRMGKESDAAKIFQGLLDAMYAREANGRSQKSD